MVGGEQAAVGEPGEAGGVVGLAEAGEPFGCGEEVGFGEHGLELALGLLEGQGDRLGLRVGPEEVDGAVVDDGDDELDLGLAGAGGEEVAQSLPGWCCDGGRDSDLEPAQSVRVRAEVDLLCGDTCWRGRIGPSHDLVGGQTHGGSLEVS